MNLRQATTHLNNCKDLLTVIKKAHGVTIYSIRYTAWLNLLKKKFLETPIDGNYTSIMNSAELLYNRMAGIKEPISQKETT